MKKQVLAAVLGLSMFALPAFAHSNDKGESDDNGRLMGLHLGIFKNLNQKLSTNQFVVAGSLASVGTNSFTVNVSGSFNVPNIVNGVTTITTDVNTKENKTLAVGQNVVATGSVSGSTLLATNVVVNMSAPKPAPQKALGKVTAKTGTSVTITNTLTNTSQTVTTDANTKVKIDGQDKTVADINVGDSGWIRFKTVGTTLIAKIIHLFR